MKSSSSAVSSTYIATISLEVMRCIERESPSSLGVIIELRRYKILSLSLYLLSFVEVPSAVAEAAQFRQPIPRRTTTKHETGVYYITLFFFVFCFRSTVLPNLIRVELNLPFNAARRVYCSGAFISSSRGD